MARFSVFLSFVVCLKNNEPEITSILTDLSTQISSLVCDYELIVIDNASSDNSVEVLKELTLLKGLPNLQVYALTKEVDFDTATCLGLENALGDFVVVFDPAVDDLSVLPEMLDKAVSGSDVVFANNKVKPEQTMGYQVVKYLFNLMYKRFNGIDLAKDAPQYRVLSRRIINFILQHNQTAISYRHLPATAGFVKSYIDYQYELRSRQSKKIGESIQKGVRLMVSTTYAPLRLVTILSLFGTLANVVYSLYILLVCIFVDNVAPGWISISLQMSGMFFLISLLMLVLGEYILHMVSITNDEPQYHVGQEFTSAKMTRIDKLNVEEVDQVQKQRNI